LKLLEDLCSGVKRLLGDARLSKASKVLHGRSNIGGAVSKRHSGSRKMSTDANLFYDGTGGDGFSRKKIPTIEYQHAP